MTSVVAGPSPSHPVDGTRALDRLRVRWDGARVWDLRHPTVDDAALAAVVLGVSLAVPPPAGGNRWLDAALSVALVLPLIFRRRAPSVVFAVVAAVALVQWVVTVPLLADTALLVALFTVAADDPTVRALAAAAVLEGGVVMASVRWRPIDDLVRSIVLLSGMAAAALCLGLAQRTRRAHLDALVDRAAELERERDTRAQLAVAAERARIARELHDVVAHNVSIMVTLADGAAAVAPSDPSRAAEAMGDVSATGRLALRDIRHLLGVLRTPADESGVGRAPQPGLSALPALVEGVQGTGLPVELVAAGPLASVPSGVGLTAYRIVQESLTNALKHATGASAVRVEVDVSSDRLEVAVIDDGAPSAGADAPGSGPAGPRAPDPAGHGHGLPGMRERVVALGGALAVGPRPGTGWEVRARLPLGAGS